MYVANVTPFGSAPTSSIDLAAYRHHVGWLAGHGVGGVVPFGTNGEGPSVSTDEEVGVLETLIGDDLGIQIVPTVAEGNLPDTVALLERVNDLPVTAVLVLPPWFRCRSPTTSRPPSHGWPGRPAECPAAPVLRAVP